MITNTEKENKTVNTMYSHKITKIKDHFIIILLYKFNDSFVIVTSCSRYRSSIKEVKLKCTLLIHEQGNDSSVHIFSGVIWSRHGPPR